jgi:hypothetical protein
VFSAAGISCVCCSRAAGQRARLEILSGLLRRAAIRTLRLSAWLSHIGAARYPRLQRREVLARNRELAGAFEGQRVFVLAAGSSAAQLDLRRLRGETVIAVNESFKMLGMSGVKPFAVAVVDAAYGSDREQAVRFMSDLSDYARRHENVDARPFFEAQTFFQGVRAHYLDLAGDLVDLAPLGTDFRLDLTRALPGLYGLARGRSRSPCLRCVPSVPARRRSRLHLDAA